MGVNARIEAVRLHRMKAEGKCHIHARVMSADVTRRVNSHSGPDAPEYCTSASRLYGPCLHHSVNIAATMPAYADLVSNKRKADDSYDQYNAKRQAAESSGAGSSNGGSWESYWMVQW
jgi:hypothetical protein